MATKVEAWRAQSGELFRTEQEAQRADRRSALSAWLEDLARNTSMGWRGEEEEEVIISYFLAHEASLRAAFDGRTCPDGRDLDVGQPESPEDPHEPLDDGLPF